MEIAVKRDGLTLRGILPILLSLYMAYAIAPFITAHQYKAALANCRLKLYEHLDHGLAGADREDMLNEIISFLTE